MKRLFGITALICGLSILLCGCTLAREDMGSTPAQGSDKLIGVYITNEYIDTFDFEAYINDNHAGITNGSMVSQSDTAAYMGRLYAQKQENGDYVFPDTDGISFYCSQFEDEIGIYVGNYMDAGICDADISLDSADGSNGIKLSGTIYAIAGRSSYVFYLNPVYQASTGEIYLIPGSGLSTSGDTAEGTVMTQTFSNECTLTAADGTSSAYSADIKIEYSIKALPLSYTFIEMDDSSHEIARHEYTPAELPHEFKASSRAAYIIAEMHTASGVERALYCPQDNTNVTIKALAELGEFGLLYEKQISVTFGADTVYAA